MKTNELESLMSRSSTPLTAAVFWSVVCLLTTACSGSITETQDPDGFQAGALEGAIATAGQVSGMRSLLVARNGVLVSESYFNGVGRDDAHDLRSVTKSVVSALIGIAIRERFLEGTHQKLGELLGSSFPDMSPECQAVTLENLLTMRAGHDWKEIPGPSEFGTFFNAPDQIAYVLAKRVVDPPGTRFNYSDGGAHLVAVVLERVTGKGAAAFANEYLLGPMGIGERSWLRDHQGHTYGGVGIRLTPRDMVAFGELFRNGGSVGGVQVVPANWVALSTHSHGSTGNAVPYGTGYGFFWWTGEHGGHEYFFATGYGGQFIVVVPELEMVVVATCDWQGVGAQAGDNWDQIISLIMKQIVEGAQ